MGNFVIPTLEEIEDHEFLRNIKTHNQNNSTHLTEPDHLLLLSYLNGKIKTKPRAVSHRSSSVSGGSSKRKKSEAGLKRKDSIKPPENKNSKLTTTLSTLPAPSIPPAPTMSVQVSPKQVNATLEPESASTPNRGALLDSIRTGAKLRKAVTNDRSRPTI